MSQGPNEPLTAAVHHELELKLVGDGTLMEAEVVAHIDALAALGEPDVVQQTDRYFDTPDRELAKAGLAARFRSAGEKRTIQVKPVPILHEDMMDREEVGAHLDPHAEPGAAIRGLIEATWPIELDADPEEQLEIKTARKRYEVTGEAFVAELCFDDVKVGGGTNGTDLGFREIEVELLSGDELPFRDFTSGLVDGLPLGPSHESKYQRALGLLGRPGYTYDVDRPAIDADEPTKDAAQALLGWQLDKMLIYATGTRVGADLEQLHKMRVSSRRIRNSLRVFRKALKKKRWRQLKVGFKWLGGVLGDVRDLDVHQVAVRDWRMSLGANPAEGWAELAAALKATWNERRVALIAAFDSPEYAELIALATKTFKEGKGWRPSPDATRPIGETAALSIGRCREDFDEAVAHCLETREANDIHEARIVGKRLRYTTELFKPLVDDALVDALGPLKAFQDELGEIQDAAQALLLVRALREEAETEAYRTVLDRIEADCVAKVETAPERVVAAARALEPGNA